MRSHTGIATNKRWPRPAIFLSNAWSCF